LSTFFGASRQTCYATQSGIARQTTCDTFTPTEPKKLYAIDYATNLCNLFSIEPKYSTEQALFIVNKKSGSMQE